MNELRTERAFEGLTQYTPSGKTGYRSSGMFSKNQTQKRAR